MERGTPSEQTGLVTGLDGDFALVQVIGGGCGRCHEEGGCGGQQLTQMFCSAPRQFRVANTVDARPGDQVVVVLPAGTLRRHATLGYGLPVLGLIGGAVVGDWLAGNGGALLGAGLGLWGAWLLLRQRSRGLAGKSANEPYIGKIKSRGVPS